MSLSILGLVVPLFDYGIIDSIVHKIADDLSPQTIIIFGSVTRHEADDDSGIDMLVVMETDRPCGTTTPIQSDTVLKDIPMDIIVVTPEEFKKKINDGHSFINEIASTGHIAYPVQSDQG